MATLPVIGDEAYYFYWAMHPAGGYYDLPPMVGWWLIPFVKVSLSPLWLRLPNLLVMSLISFGIYECLTPVMEKKRAGKIACLFLFLPFPFLSIFMFPDVPLLFFSFFSSLLFFLALQQKEKASWVTFLFSGSLWGAAFLSKYFAVLLIPVFGIFLLWKHRRAWPGLILFGLGALPFIFQHLHWNARHCWANFVFNLITRQKSQDGSVFQTTGYYLLYLVILSSPFLWGAFDSRLRINLKQEWKRLDGFRDFQDYALLLWLIPVLSFGSSALMGKGQGLHWLLFVLPFFTIWAGCRLGDSELRRALRDLMAFTGGLTLFAVLTLAFPGKILAPFFEHRFHFEYSLATHPEEFVETVLKDVKSTPLAFTEGYTFSSILNYEMQKYAKAHHITLPEVSVWGSGSRFGRVFDWSTDFKVLDGKKLIIITPGFLIKEKWTAYFNTIVVETRTFEGQNFYVTTGEGFKASEYLHSEFRKPVEGYYPKFLPAICSLRDITGLGAYGN
ncbi:MAG: glycosyltransferase family 39 protein [Bdellovibrionales bacterium]|nr:glycosyltransferase family 39 protein [Oligoflexia bacterium]